MLIRIGKASAAALLACTLLGLGACSRTEQLVAAAGAIGVGGGAIVAAAAGGSVLGGAIVGGALGAGGGYIASR
jgi:hypothetical protein